MNDKLSFSTNPIEKLKELLTRDNKPTQTYGGFISDPTEPKKIEEDKKEKHTPCIFVTKENEVYFLRILDMGVIYYILSSIIPGNNNLIGFREMSFEEAKAKMQKMEQDGNGVAFIADSDSTTDISVLFTLLHYHLNGDSKG